MSSMFLRFSDVNVVTEAGVAVVCVLVVTLLVVELTGGVEAVVVGDEAVEGLVEVRLESLVVVLVGSNSNCDC